MKTLGVSCYYHDSAACLIEDGKVVKAVAEERISRKKHDSGFPKKAIDFCLEGIKNGDIDWVVFYEKPFLKFERINLTSLATVPFGRGMFVDAYRVWLTKKLWVKSELSNYLKISPDKILFCGHHLSHAASAYYTSPFKSAAILTCDGVGEWTTTTLGVGSQNKIEIKKEIKFPHSLGLFYSAFTQFLGFQINEGEFKVMGLAPYGQPLYTKKIEKIINQKSDGSFKLDLSYFDFPTSEKRSYSKKFVDLLGVKPVDPKDSDKVVQVYADIAASAQKVLEDKLLVIAKHLRNQTDEENLCYAGGVALNGVANWRIFKEAGFKNIFVHPEAGDAGGALGAGLYLYHHVLGNPRKIKFENIYLGGENSEEDIKKFLKQKKMKAKKLSDKELVKKVVGMLLDKKVVGWVRGRVEWGPRALGARSILADPRDKSMKDLVNSKIKFREAFRPFAPVVICEKANEYFNIGKAPYQQPLEYMIAVVPVRKKYHNKLGAITHVDGTARPQIISKSQNKLYYEIIKEFGKKTGISVLLNTSFNLKGEAIVNTCEDAYETFMKSGIDALVLGNFLIEKVSS
jgi:carbamoyltransferase